MWKSRRFGGDYQSWALSRDAARIAEIALLPSPINQFSLSPTKVLRC